MSAVAQTEAETKAGAVQQIPLDEVFETEGVQPRKIDKRHVESLVATYTGPDSWPPILVERVKGGNGEADWYGILDGHHRVTAAQEIRKQQTAENEKRAHAKPPLSPLPVLSTIAARVLPESEDTGHARVVAIEANIKNGLPMPRKVRLELAERLHDMHPALSNREIARRAGVDEGTVRNILKRRAGESQEAREERYSYASDVPAARKLLKAAKDFYQSEKSGFLGLKGSGTEEAAQKRLKALISEAKKGDKQEMIAICQSLVQTLTATAQALKSAKN